MTNDKLCGFDCDISMIQMLRGGGVVVVNVKQGLNHTGTTIV